jgi:hypothetical protein
MGRRVTGGGLTLVNLAGTIYKRLPRGLEAILL